MNKLIYMVTEDDAFETGTDSAGVDYEYIFVKTATGIKKYEFIILWPILRSS